MKRYFFLLLLTISSSVLISSSAMANPTLDQARAAAATMGAIDKLGTGAGALAVAYVAITTYPVTSLAIMSTGIVSGGCLAATFGAPVAIAATTFGAYWVCQKAWDQTKALIKGN